jgi:hypothetical protein
LILYFTMKLAQDDEIFKIYISLQKEYIIKKVE